MTNEDILTLAKAGFNAQQIAALNQIQPAVAQQPVVPQTLSQPVAVQPLDAMSQQIAALTQAVQANAIVSANQPKVQTTDDILAEIINPPAVIAAQNGGNNV